MKSFLIIAGTFALLVGLFVGYTMMQTGRTVVDLSDRERPVDVVIPPAPGEAILGEGEDAWVEMRDEHWQVVSRFRARRYDPQRDGRVQVTAPEAVFFMSDGQRLRVRGREGVVAMSRLPEPGEDPRNIGPRQAPDRGELRDVEIELFGSQADLDADAPEAPTELLRVTLDNAAFDNETFRIFTEDTRIDGRPVPRDRVPVIVTGRDYEFAGQGLTIRWNEKDRRLDLLQIAHGERLVVKSPDALAPGRLKRRSASGERAAAAASLPPMLAAADPAGAAEALPQADDVRPAYRATFSEKVRILQGEAEVAAGDELFVDFVFERADEKPTTEPAAERPSGVAVLAAAADPPPASPATQPVPITILWTGPLVVTPLPDEAPRPAADAANVHLVGSPLRLVQDSTQVLARSLVYDTGAQRLAIESSPAHPLVMSDGKGGSIESGAMSYSMAERIAIFTGRSRALLPMRSAGDAPPQALTARWAERCVLHLAGEGLESLVAERAELSGEVMIDHPALKLSADRLDLVMAADAPGEAADADVAGADRMQLREVVAAGKVQCEVLDARRKAQSIAAERLKINTASDGRGRLFVRRLEADGDVVARDETQTFKAGHLTATLSPAQEEAAERRADDRSPAEVARKVDLEHFIAQDGAEYTSADGKRAAADQIEVLMKDGQPFMTLLGDAKVADGTNVLYGPHIQVSGAEQKATVLGAGSLEAQRESAGGPPRPVTVEWQKGVIADGKANRVDVTGRVIVTTAEADGASHAIEGDQLAMALEDAPAKEGEKPKADRPLLQEKLVKTSVISGNMVVRSLRTAGEGAIVRRLEMKAPTLEYDLPARTMTVPAAGTLLFEDHPDRAEAPAPKDERERLAGATAMRWDRRLVYDEPAGKIRLEGDVLIVYEADDRQKQPGFRLSAQSVTAELATTPPVPEADGAPREPTLEGRDLQRFIAEKAVHFEAQGVELEAQRVEYDPAAGIMTATGTETHPVRILRGLSRGSFGQAKYNLRTNHLQVTDFRGNVR